MKTFFKSNKIAIISDLHFGCHKDSDIWINIIDNYINWFINKLSFLKIKNILILGDIFNNRNEISVNTIHNAAKILSKFIDKQINVMAITGNHDLYYKNINNVYSTSVFDKWDNINILNEMESIQIENKTITICPWIYDLNKIPKSDILFGHFEINGFKHNNTHIAQYGINYKDILSKSKLIFSGHFHINQEREYENGKIIYVGSPYEISWSDYASRKGFYILNIDTLNYEFIENNISPKHMLVRLSEIINNKSNLQNIFKSFNNNIIKFIIDYKLEEKKIYKLIEKIEIFKPLELTLEYELQEIKELNINENNFKNIDIIESINEYINLLEINEDIKDKTKSYILEKIKKYN